MTPSIWSVLIIFVVAPLAVVGLVTTIVLLTTSPSHRRAEADQIAPDNADDQEGTDENEAEDGSGESPGGDGEADSASE